MGTNDMIFDTLFNQTTNIIEMIETLLSRSLETTNYKICIALETELSYSLSHIRDVFHLSTGLSLGKYITRRKYTEILLLTDCEAFFNLKSKEKVCGIASFKQRCIKEFPDLATEYVIENMQPMIDESTLTELLTSQVDKKGKKYIRNKFAQIQMEEIKKNRTPIVINDSEKSLLIQDDRKILIDLDTTYFQFRNIAFKLTSHWEISQRKCAWKYQSHDKNERLIDIN